ILIFQIHTPQGLIKHPLFHLYHSFSPIFTPVHAPPFHSVRNMTLIGLHSPKPPRIFWRIFYFLPPIKYPAPMMTDVSAVFLDFFSLLFFFQRAFIGIKIKLEFVPIMLFDRFSDITFI